MISQASFTLRNRNPDILTCIANLSNDEVFTPPEFANRMLDTPAKAWAADNGGQKIPDSVLGKPWISSPSSISTQSFLAFWVGSESEAQSIESYFCTKFFRHLVSLRKLTQHALRSTYSWVPQQSWDREWTDEELYKKQAHKGRNRLH